MPPLYPLFSSVYGSSTKQHCLWILYSLILFSASAKHFNPWYPGFTVPFINWLFVTIVLVALLFYSIFCRCMLKLVFQKRAIWVLCKQKKRANFPLIRLPIAYVVIYFSGTGRLLLFLSNIQEQSRTRSNSTEKERDWWWLSRNVHFSSCGCFIWVFILGTSLL